MAPRRGEPEGDVVDVARTTGNATAANGAQHS